MEDMNVDLLFHHGGKWTLKPHLLYDERYVHSLRAFNSNHLNLIDIKEVFENNLSFVLVKQVLVKGPSGNLFLVQDSDGIRILQELLTEAFRVVHVFTVDDNEEIVFAPNIINHSETYHVQCEYGTDAESESDDGLVDRTSDGEYDFDELEIIKMQKNKEVNANLSHYKDLFLNVTFKNLDDARKTCNLYALATKKPLKVAKSDRKRLRYRCIEGCPFAILVSLDGKGPGYKLKTFKQEHNCEEALHNPRATTNTLSHYFKSKVQNNPKYALKDMKQDLMDNFNLNTNDSKLKRAKRMALQKMQGSFLDEYNRLEAYANEIRMTNPSSDVVINLSKDAMVQGKRKFLRMYICFNAMKVGWKEGLRPLIGLDGTFLKGQCKGQLLVAMAQDCDNSFYPLVWAIVDKETTTTWTWFLQLLAKSLNLKNGDSITFMSDMQKGLLNAVENVLPLSNHRYCVRHVEANWMKRFRTGKMKKLMWWAAWCTYEEDFKDQLNALGALSEEAAKDLVKFPPQKWCRTYFDTVCKNQLVDNNFTESFNSWILVPRGKPILKMLEEIRDKIMNSKIANLCKLEFNGDLGFEVSEGEDRHIVNIVEKKCSCRPKFKRDREKNAAIKRFGEWSHSRKGTKMTLSKCGSQAHNARSCKASEEGSISSLKRKRGRTEEAEQDEEVFDVNSSAPQLTQEGFESDIYAPRQRQYEPFGPTRELESDHILRPRIIFEELTRLKMRQNQQTRSANRVITFRGDHRGVSEPTYLPYSPTKVTWKGKEVMTSNQLERAREKKVGKLKTKKANGRSQI
ncbi:hypothetical protein MTR67_006989 [Solanum verrucosum]|uniref:MULE transposase domain-containing protein n=1 Tax=Solanum verrucosum TaxID=315347 RepID=A0AAF0PYU5_SOLVR|nr:hypothetical protein MTR67_006989 [Solanum verrucosum]